MASDVHSSAMLHRCCVQGVRDTFKGFLDELPAKGEMQTMHLCVTLDMHKSCDAVRLAQVWEVQKARELRVLVKFLLSIPPVLLGVLLVSPFGGVLSLTQS